MTGKTSSRRFAHILHFSSAFLLFLLVFSPKTTILVAQSARYISATRKAFLPSPGVSLRKNTADCPAIPANFDFANATDSQIRQYHLPPRPKGSQQVVDHWLETVKGVAQVTCVSDSNRQVKPKTVRPASTNCLQAAPSGTTCSYNWNGYVAGDGTPQGFQDVWADWHVPCVQSGASPSGSAVTTWVGLGGWFNGESLWQAGSAWNPSSGYYVWYDAVNANGSSIVGGDVNIASVNCGDHIFGDVYFDTGNPSSNVYYFLSDGTTGDSWSGYAPSGFTSGHVSAEWIDERPACDKGLYKFADFNYTEWTYTYTVPDFSDAGSGSIGSFTHTRVWAEDNDGSNTRLAWSDYLGSETGSGTDNFRSHWEANGTGQC